MNGAVILVVVLVIFGLWYVAIYNEFVSWKNRAKDGWAQIDVQLKRRNDLIPNLVETVKGYAAHEKTVLEEVTKARTACLNAQGVAETAKADNKLSQTLKSLFAVTENYPDLKANRNFLSLQEELTSTENKISFARQFYNDTVAEYNTRLQKIPNNFIATLARFQPEEFFHVDVTAERQVPRVTFP